MSRPPQVRPVILTFVGQYLPGYKAGGPIRTIANLVEQLGDEFEFRIVAADRDLGEVEPYPEIETNTWLPVGKAFVFYRSAGAGGWTALLRTVATMDFDMIYLNSVFCTGASLRPLMYRWTGQLEKKPVLLAPRGEFSAGALAIKPHKKRLFLTLARTMGLYRNVTFQASSNHEALDIARTLGEGVPILIASDLSRRSAGAPSIDVKARNVDRSGPLRAVFLSRISPMKNLLGAFSILRELSTPLIIDIYGVIEDKSYWSACQGAIRDLPPHVQAHYKGALSPDRVESVLAHYDFFFLPTLGENYGHVIREALSAGLPVLISDRTPWRNLASDNVGADLSLDSPRDYVAWIERYADLDAHQRLAMRRAAQAKGNDPKSAERHRLANRVMLHSILDV